MNDILSWVPFELVVAFFVLGLLGKTFSDLRDRQRAKVLAQAREWQSGQRGNFK